MTASDHTLKPFRNLLHQRGHPYMHRSRPEDSPHESSVIADGYEQLDTDERQDPESAPPRETRPPSPPDMRRNRANMPSCFDPLRTPWSGSNSSIRIGRAWFLRDCLIPASVASFRTPSLQLQALWDVAQLSQNIRKADPKRPV